MKLPIKNERGFFEIRLEAIGGLGANLAGQILAEAAVLSAGYNGVNFSSYGSEKKGTPVRSFIRLAEYDTEIFDHSPVEFPHVIAIFHESLYKTVPVTKGIQANGIVLVNTTKDFQAIRELLALEHGRVATVDATGIAIEENSRVNMVMLGALCRLLPFIKPEYLYHTIERTFASKNPSSIEANTRAFTRGVKEVRIEHEGKMDRKLSKKAVSREKSRSGYQTMPIGGIVTLPANSMEKDLSISRTGFLPALNLNLCIHCAKCDLVCPDFCFVWEEKEDKRGRPMMFLKGIDYQYCKGCLKCIEACPSDALQPLRETVYDADDHRIPQEKPIYNKEGY